MTLARELIEAGEREICQRMQLCPRGLPKSCDFTCCEAVAQSTKNSLLHFLRTLRERGPSEGMHGAAYGEGSPIGHGANAVWGAMLAELIREIEEER